MRKLQVIWAVIRGGTVVYRATIVDGQLRVTRPHSVVTETTVLGG